MAETDSHSRSRPEAFWSDPKLIALANAISAGDVARIDQFVAEGVDVNAEGKEHMAPLGWAWARRNKAAYKRLLEHGADPNYWIPTDESLLFAIASAKSDSEWLKMALEHKGDPNLDRRHDGQTPIFAALDSRRRESLELLINAGADVNHRDKLGETPAIYAAGRNWFNSVYYLLEAGADFRIHDNYGIDVGCRLIDTRVSAAHELAAWREKVIDWLLDKGHNFNEAKVRAAREGADHELARWAEEQEARVRRWLETDPKSARDYRLRAAAWMEKRQWDRAIAEYAKAIAREPENALNYRLRAAAWDLKSVLAKMPREEIDKALADYAEAIRLNPRDAVAFAGRAALRHNERDYAGSIADYSEAIRLNPTDAVNFWRRADSLWRDGFMTGVMERYDQAIADCDQALVLDHRDPRAYVQRGIVLRQLSNLDKAIADFTEALQIDSRYADAFLERGRVWCQKARFMSWKKPMPPEVAADYEKAIADYTEAIRLNPNSGAAHAGRGEIWELKRDYDKALADYSEAIRLVPDFVGYRTSRAVVWRAKGDHDKAIADYSEAIRLDPADRFIVPNAYVGRGQSWLEKGEYDRAISDANEALRLANLSEAADLRRSALLAAWRFREVIADLEREVGDPKNTYQPFGELAWLLATCADAEQRDAERAVEYAKKACERSKWKSHVDLKILAAAYAESRQFEDAVATQEKAIEVAPDEATKDQYREQLSLYKKGEALRDRVQ